MAELQHDLADLAFSKFIQKYKEEHPNFSYDHARSTGMYANSYYLTVAYNSMDRSAPIEIKRTICMYYSAPFLFLRDDPTRVVIERGLDRLKNGLNSFENEVKQELIKFNKYNVNDLVNSAYADFKSTSPLN